MGDQFNSTPGSNAWLARQINEARKAKRAELRPQVAATIYSGMLAAIPYKESWDMDQLMELSISQADTLLLKLYPPLPDLDNGLTK